MTPDSESRRKILNRLRRARGQLDAVISTIETGGHCRDVVTQLSAVTSALDRAGFVIVATAMRHCISDDVDADPEDQLTIDELEKLFLTLT